MHFMHHDICGRSKVGKTSCSPSSEAALHTHAHTHTVSYLFNPYNTIHRDGDLIEYFKS